MIGGRLCDIFGRKQIYQYDMLFYAFGMLFLIFAAAPWMIIVGFLLARLYLVTSLRWLAVSQIIIQTRTRM